MSAAKRTVRAPRQHRSERAADPISSESTPTWRWPWTWFSIRMYLQDKYGGSYSKQELRDLEVKWRRIFASAGWSVKGQ